MRTWAEIDLSALEHNYRTLRAMLAPGCRFLGLCKANAYGHGAAVIGKELEELGAEMLAVACVSEAIELRHSGVTAPILCLGETPEECYPLLLEHHITQMVEERYGSLRFQDLYRIMSDHTYEPNCICRHPHEGVPATTVSSTLCVVEDFEVWTTLRNPCMALPHTNILKPARK